MTNEQFKFWLKGYLEGKDSLDKGAINKILSKKDEVFEPLPLTTDTVNPNSINPFWYNQPQYHTTCKG